MTFGYVSINGESIKEETDITTKQRLLEKDGAIVSKNLDGELTITGPFTISRQEDNDDSGTLVVNSGTFIIRTALILGSFKNSARGHIRIDSGSLEDIFTSPTHEQYTDFQRGRKSLGSVVVVNKLRP